MTFSKIERLLSSAIRELFRAYSCFVDRILHGTALLGSREQVNHIINEMYVRQMADRS